jgi:hypothetical protein
MKNVFFTSVLLLGLVLVYSCSNEESPDFLEGNMKTILPTTMKSRVISKSEIPDGAKIIEVENEEEKNALISKLTKSRVRFVFQSESRAAENEPSLFALKSLEKIASPESGSVESGWYVVIDVDLIYHGCNDPIDVTSTALIVGKSDHVVKQWKQTSSTAHWTNSFTAIDYYVAGKVTLVCYVYDKKTKKYEEVPETYELSTSGREQIY